MIQKSKLKTFFDSKPSNKDCIEMYETHLVFFNELINTGKIEELEYVLPIKLVQYAVALSDEGYYKKCLSVLSEIEQELDMIKGRSKWYKQYHEVLQFRRGVCLSRLKKYKKSNIEFSSLLKNKPENDNYMEWYRHNQSEIVITITRPIIYTLILVSMLAMIAKHIGYYTYAVTLIDFLTFTSGVLLFIIERIIVYVIKRNSHLFDWHYGSKRNE